MRKDREHQEEPSEPAAGNGILNRRVFLERTLLTGVAGAVVAGSGTAGRERGAAPGAALDDAAGRPVHRLWATVPFRGQSRARIARGTQSGHRRDRRLPYSAPSAQRHDHAERPAFRPQPFRHAGYRSRSASALDPWPGEAAAGVHARGAGALSDGIAHRLRRVRRQLGRAQRAAGAAAQRGGDPRPRLVRGMDRRAARDPAGRGRRRAERQMGGGRGRRRRRHEPQRAAREVHG